MDNIFENLIHELTSKKLTIASAESLTGGLMSSKLVDVSGASKTFKEAFITYCDEAKIRTLNVPEEIIRKYGAISAQCAYYMALGAAENSGVDIAVSFTGNAGPLADEAKDVGLVYIGLYFNGNTKTFEYHFSGTRDEIRNRACDEGARLIWEKIK